MTERPLQSKALCNRKPFAIVCLSYICTQVASHTGGVRVIGATSAQPPPHQRHVSVATATPAGFPPSSFGASQQPPPPAATTAAAGVQGGGARVQAAGMTAGASLQTLTLLWPSNVKCHPLSSDMGRSEKSFLSRFCQFSPVFEVLLVDMLVKNGIYGRGLLFSGLI